MALEFVCPACRSQLCLANPRLVGKRIKCPMCGDAVSVAVPPPPAPQEAEPLAPALPSFAVTERSEPGRRAFDEEKRPAPRSWEDEDDDARPRRRRGAAAPKQGGNSALMWILLTVGGSVVVCGGFATVIVVLVNNVSNAVNQEREQMVRAIAQAEEADKARQQALQANKVKQAPQGGFVAAPPAVNEKGQAFDVPLQGLTIPGQLAVGDPRDLTNPQSYCKVYRVQMFAGRTYTIRMNAQNPAQLDTLLRLEDTAFQQLALNDDAPGEHTLNSRIDFACTQTGIYRVVATSLLPNVEGDYTLTIRRTK